MKKIENVLLFLILLFLPTQLGRHFWPDFSHVFSLRIDYLSPSLYFWDVLVIGLIFVWVIDTPKVNKLALNLWMIFLLSQSLSLVNAQNLGAGLVRLEQYGIAGLLGIYLASQGWSNLKQKLFLPLAVGIFFESLLAVAQFFKGGTLGFWILGERTFNLSTPGIAKFDFYGLEFLRPYGTFPHPNVLAGYMVVVLSLLSSRILLIIGGIIIFLTMSRVVILAGFISGLLVLPKKWKLVLVAAALLLSPIIFTRFESIFSYDSLTILRREELFQSSWNLFLKNPVFGVGLNNFISAQQDLVSGPSRFLQPVHNIFLLALSETGLIGLIGLIILFFPVFKLSPLRFPLYAILFLGLFDHYFLTLPQGYRLLFLVWGISFCFIGGGLKKQETRL